MQRQGRKRGGPAGSGSWRRRALLAVLLVALAVLAWNWRPLNDRAFAEASHAARIGCSCRFVAGRDMSQCRADIPSGFGMITLSQDEEGKSVTARFLPLASQTATFRQGWGCLLEPFGD